MTLPPISYVTVIRDIYFTERTLTGHRPRKIDFDVCEPDLDSLPEGAGKVNLLPNALPDFLEPRLRIGAVNHAPEIA